MDSISQRSNATVANDWQERLQLIMDMMREMSSVNDPQEMVRRYGERMRQLIPPLGRRLSLSRRGLSYPFYRITRSTTWTEDINPWKESDRLPLFEGGLLAEMIYGDQTVVIDDLELPAEEPAFEYLAGQRSVLAMPMYDQGESLNMVVLLQEEANAFDREQIPDLVWRSNLFGRATSNLVVKEELRQAYHALDLELKIVADIQRSLLPRELPKIPTLDLATFYQPATRAGGDYYDFFPLPGNRYGILIADVSGHGTPAAVLMAVTHCIAHTHPGPAMPPGKVLEYMNQHLISRYTNSVESFVTAFYGIYDVARRELTYANAGHNPPRLKRCQDGSLRALSTARGLPLGIFEDSTYPEAVERCAIGDQIILYTDGVTDAQNPEGEIFGTERLDAALETCSLQAQGLLDSLLASAEEFTEGRRPEDDRTIIIARVI